MDETKPIIFPARLREGDTVGVISPSSPVLSEANLEKGMEALRKLGLVPKLAPNARKGHQNYMAGTREERLADFHEMFVNPEVKGIFCTGGGYAALQLLPDISWGVIKKNPKILVGYSDIVTLLLAIWKRTRMITFHGSSIENLDANDSEDAFTLQNFKNILMDGTIGALSRYSRWEVLRAGEARGTLLGGNLDLLLDFVGNRYAPNWNNVILFWEETEETVEAIDRFLWRLRIAGVFNKISGMIVGKVTELQPVEEEGDPPNLGKPPEVQEVILEATKGFSFPILYGADFGHEVAGITLPIGADVYLDCNPPFSEGRISIMGSYLSDWNKK